MQTACLGAPLGPLLQGSLAWTPHFTPESAKGSQRACFGIHQLRCASSEADEKDMRRGWTRCIFPRHHQDGPPRNFASPGHEETNWTEQNLPARKKRAV